MKIIPVQKNENLEQPVPTIWRLALKNLADKVVLGTETDTLAKIEIEQIDKETEIINRNNIDNYPDKLGPLHEQSWETSIYIWDSTSWKVLVDLTDINGHITDLVLHNEVYETDSGYLIEPGLIYVP